MSGPADARWAHPLRVMCRARAWEKVWSYMSIETGGNGWRAPSRC